jgi:hypothetical protein
MSDAPATLTTTTPIPLSIFSFNSVMELRLQLVSRLVDRVECLRRLVSRRGRDENLKLLSAPWLKSHGYIHARYASISRAPIGNWCR